MSRSFSGNPLESCLVSFNILFLMLHPHPFARATRWIFPILAAAFFLTFASAQTNTNIRVMAANLNGNTQSYQPFALRIFQGLKPDVVCIQEFNYTSTNGLGVNTPAAFQEMINAAFGTNFVYFREPFNANGDIPNGIISRYPIVASGSWTDNLVNNRGFAWAQIHLPGTNDLYVVSVHLLTSSATDRAGEAVQLKSMMQSNFPANAWVVLAGDFNTDTRTESAMVTFDSFLSDNPVPVDNNGNSDTSENRNHPHDYVLPSFLFTNVETASVFPSHTFPNGLVFDSMVYTPLSDVAPVQFSDSTNAQHMAVIKDFLVTGTNAAIVTNPPSIDSQPQDETVPAGGNATFSVSASGSVPLNYQWYFNTNTLIGGATTNSLTITNAQAINAGSYSVIITNTAGSITSAVAILTVTDAPPTITTQPQNQAINAGGNATFSVAASGTTPLGYQWYFNTNTLIPGATTNPLAIINAQSPNAGTYSVIVSNSVGSVTSSVANLTIISSPSSVIAQWNFNSVTPDANTTTGRTTPSIGTGTASLVGGATATFATGDTVLDPAGSTDNSGWNTATYPTQGTGSKTRGAQFNMSTAGKQNITISWSSQSSATGSKYGQLQYSTNGTDFIDFSTAFTNGTSFTPKTNSLASISSVNDNPNFAIRLVSAFQSAAAQGGTNGYEPADPTKIYGSAGTMRYDIVTISGTAIVVNNPPPSPPTLSAPTIVPGNQVQMTVTGTAGSNYVIQVSTNLVGNNWVSIFTNSAPFTFTDSNFNNLPEAFYRALVAP